MRQQSGFYLQRGAALVVALLILLVVTVLGLTSIGTSTMELRMASNSEAQQESFQQAQAAADYLTANPSLVPVIGGVGYKLCTANITGCDQNNIDLPTPPFKDGAGEPSTLRVTRENPGTGLPPRLLATSSAAFAAAYYSAESTYDDAASGRGRTRLTVGLMRIIPK